MRRECRWTWGLVAAAVLGIAAGAGAALQLEPRGSRMPDAGRAADWVAELALDARQLEALERLRSSERPGIERLRLALAHIEARLRHVELEQPFDAGRVNELVSEQAEVLAYLRGSESRIVAQIADLLTPDQGRRFEKLRGEQAARIDLDVLPPARPAGTPL